MSFFTAKDFAGSTEMIDHISWKDAASVANAKHDKRFEQLKEALDIAVKELDRIEHYTTVSTSTTLMRIKELTT